MLPIILSFYYAQILQGNVSQEIIKDYITTEALVVGVDPQLALGIAEAESGFNPESSGDHNTSHGLFQIHLPAHPNITKKQAEDIIFSTTWSLQEMKKNGCMIWSTCKAVKSRLNASHSLTGQYKSSDTS